MAAMQSRSQSAVGSTQWIADEQENIQHFINLEAEDFSFSARNEIDWLNEHMADIFTSNQFNVTEIFKTPGKLRGKTPRTARKRNPLEARVPLSDAFSSNQQLRPNQSPPKQIRSPLPTVIASDPETIGPIIGKPTKQPADSGYHGLTEDEMDVDYPTQPVDVPTQEVNAPEDREEPVSTSSSDVKSPSEDRRTTEGSFHSAREAMTAEVDVNLPPAEVVGTTTRIVEAMDMGQQPADQSSPMLEHPPEMQEEPRANSRQMFQDIDNLDDLGSPSDGSTPDRPLLRKKSSLTFASLPPREPLKKSMGARVSHTDQPMVGASRNSYFDRLTNGRLTQPAQDADVEKMNVDYDTQTIERELSEAESQTRKLHNKASTQRLYESINMLGQSSRPSKSIPLIVPVAPQIKYPELPSASPEQPAALPTDTDDEDDWIKPIGPRSPPVQRPLLMKSYAADVMQDISDKNTIGRLEGTGKNAYSREQPEGLPVLRQVFSPIYGHGKSASTTVLPSPSKAAINPGISHSKTISVSNPTVYGTSFTPAGSPKRFADGPASAKMKLKSLMKTAQNLFTSSAGISAAAKMETLPPQMKMLPNLQSGQYPGSLDPAKQRALPDSPSREDGRRTRSSTEKEHKKKEKEAKEQQKATDELEKARAEESRKAAQLKQDKNKALPAVPTELGVPQSTRTSPRRAHESKPAESKTITQPSSIQGLPQRPNQQRKPIPKPSRDAVPKPQPQSFAINLPGTRTQRFPLPASSASTALAKTLESSLPPSLPPKKTVMKKGSNSSLTTTTSHTSYKSSTSTKPKALIAAEKKKEADEKEAERKREQKREIERRKVAQQEEARQREAKQRTENEKKERERVTADEAKRAAQRQQIEKRRLEIAKKEQQRNGDMDKHGLSTNRNDAGPARAPSRMGSVQLSNRPVNATQNPIRHEKRPFEEEDRPVIRVGANPHQGPESKRRKTEDEDHEPPARLNAPPSRPSVAHPKPVQKSIFAHPNYIPAPAAPHAQQHAPSLFKQPLPPHHNTINRVAHPNEMAQYSSNPIPFGSNPNNANTSHHYKTPASTSRPPILVKSSPQIPNADDHPLEEIRTDDESDSQASSPATLPSRPQWTQSDAIERALLQQENLNPDAIFGPVAQIHMDEIFKGADKNRQKRWRDRTSSANWERSGDLLTREEVARDVEAREKLRREGGWKFGL